MNILLSDVLFAYRGVRLKPGIQNPKKTRTKHRMILRLSDWV